MQKVVGSLIVSIKLSEQTALVSLSKKLNQSNLKAAGSLNRKTPAPGRYATKPM